MDELTLAKTERGEFETSYKTEKARADGLEAQLGFYMAGVADPETAILYWEKLPADERAATTPADYAASMAAKKPQVFGKAQQQLQTPPPSGFGGSPLQEGEGQAGGGFQIITDPQNQSDINKVLENYDRMFNN